MDKLERYREEVLAAVGRLPPERLPMLDAAGRWLVEPVLAPPRPGVEVWLLEDDVP